MTSRVAVADDAPPLRLPEDLEFLRRQGYRWSATQEGSYVCLVIFGYRLPNGYATTETRIIGNE